MAAECEKRVGAGLITFACHLERGHKGPCEAIESEQSKTRRRAWLSKQETPRLHEFAASLQETRIPLSSVRQVLVDLRASLTDFTLRLDQLIEELDRSKSE